MSAWLDALPEAAKTYLEGRRLDEVECVISDLPGIARGKAVPASKFAKTDYFHLPDSIFYQTITGDWADAADEDGWIEKDMCRAYDPAVSEVTKAIELFPGFPVPHRHLAACYAQLGNRPAAARECGRVLDLEPGFSVARISKTLPFARAQDLEHYCEGLRQAGLPE